MSKPKLDDAFDHLITSISRPMTVVSEKESLYRLEIRCWVALDRGHGLSELLGMDVLPRSPVTSVIELPPFEDGIKRWDVTVDGVVYRVSDLMEVGDEVHVVPEHGMYHAYRSEVRRERWFDPRTGTTETYIVCGSERDAVFALCRADGFVENVVVACPLQGAKWARRRSYVPVFCGNAFDGSVRVQPSPGEYLAVAES